MSRIGFRFEGQISCSRVGELLYDAGEPSVVGGIDINDEVLIFLY